MTYDIIFSDLAFKQLKKLDRGHQERIIKAMERIRIRPEAYVTKLVGFYCQDGISKQFAMIYPPFMCAITITCV
jgi:hypothetical protein